MFAKKKASLIRRSSKTFREDDMTQHTEDEHPFYGIEIIRRQEQAHILNVLKKYRHEAVTEELKAKIWDDLQMEKHQGRLTIPFKVVMQCDALKNYPDYIEIILETKV